MLFRSEASEAYNICLKLAPERTDCATNLASVLVDQGNEALAEGLYRRVLAIDESHADAAFNLGLLLQDRKTDAATREAAKLYQVAVAKEPARWDAWANLAAALSELKATNKREIAEQLNALAERHAALWLVRSRPGGLEDSADRLLRVSAALGAT